MQKTHDLSDKTASDAIISRKRTIQSSILFFSLVVGGCISPMIASAPKERLCDANETAVVCARNWANAAGNVFAFAAASIAAFFAFGQWRASNRQALVAMLPALKDTFSAAGRLIDIIAEIDLQLASMIDQDNIFMEMLKAINISADLIDSFCMSSQQRGLQVISALQNVNDFDRQALTFTGLEDAYKQLYAASLHLQIRTQAADNSIRLVQMIAQSRKGTIIPLPASIIPPPDLDLIGRAAETRKSSRSRIQDIRKLIENSAELSLIKRAQALAE